MKTFVALCALLAVAIANPLPLVQVVINVDSNQAAIVDDGAINGKPEPAVPELPEDSEILPGPAILPEPVFPDLPKPEVPENPAPVEPEFYGEEEILLPKN